MAPWAILTGVWPTGQGRCFSPPLLSTACLIPGAVLSFQLLTINDSDTLECIQQWAGRIVRGTFRFSLKPEGITTASSYLLNVRRLWTEIVETDFFQKIHNIRIRGKGGKVGAGGILIKDRKTYFTLGWSDTTTGCLSQKGCKISILEAVLNSTRPWASKYNWIYFEKEARLKLQISLKTIRIYI